MNLSEILKTIREEIENDDKARERVLPITREIVRLCSQSVKATHRGQYDEAARLLEDACKMMAQASSEATSSEFISRTRILDAAYQELAEAANLLSIIQGRGFVAPEEIGVSTRPFLTGLADTIGELRRAVLDALRSDNISRASELLDIMEDILDELLTFDFPEALIPELRRKCDVARALIERTRGDLTTGVLQEKLIREIKNFEERLNRD